MATLNTGVLSLMDWAKRLDPDGKVPQIVELLAKTNEILLDQPFMQGNLPTGHRMTMRTGLPTVAWRLINQGITPSKSRTTQVDEACGMLEAWSEVDSELVRLSGDPNGFRFSEAQAFIEAMNQEAASTLFYGNSGTDPEQYTGLSIRYSDTSAPNGRNIIDAAGSGSDNTSIWLIVWGAQTCFGLFPQGSKAGLVHRDLGEGVIETVAGVGGARMLGFREQYQWKLGLGLRDWRYVVRIANIDVSNLVAESSNADLTKLMTKALWRIPAMGMGKAAFYVNRTIGEYLDIQRRADVLSGGQLGYADVDGRRTMMFRGVPIRICDSLLETEDAVS